MAPGANVPSSKSGTGTVPKSKTRNNPVPREMVAPTRRDMQMNSAGSMENYDWRIESENSGGNIGERGPPAHQTNNYSTFFDIFADLDTTASHDNNRFVPVRPQPRSLGLSQQEDEAFHNNNFHSNSPSNMAANTAIVMPTTPGTSRTRETTPYRRSADRSCVVFNSVSSQNDGQNESTNQNNAASQTLQSNNTTKSNNIVSQSHDRQMLEQKLHQIREYLKVTSTLMQSVGDENQMVTEEDVDMLRLVNDLKDSEAKLLNQLSNLNDDDTDNESHNSNREEASDVTLSRSTSKFMKRFTNLINIVINQVRDKQDINNPSTSDFNNDSFQEMERASSSLSQTSQSSYNTLSTKLLPQQTVNQMCSTIDRSKVDRKNKKQFKNSSSQKSGNQSSTTTTTTENNTHLNTICDDMMRNLQFSNNHENLENHDQIKRVSDLNERQLQSDLRQLLETFKNNAGCATTNDVITSQGGSGGSSRDVTPVTNENTTALDVTVNQLQGRLQKLRTLSAEQNNTDVYQQLENIKSLHERIAMLRQRTAEREELNRVLGERDEHLTAEHRALQEKLRDLHNKKEQVEKLVNDLQNLACGPPTQETSIASMRSQLATFQSMLDNVARTETEMNSNPSMNQQQPLETTNNVASGSNCNVTKYESDRTRNHNVYHPIDFPIENRDSLDEEEDVARGGGRFDKKINKSAPAIGPFQRQQMILKAELQAKKRELEELMRKDQDCTSTINQDVCSVTSIDKSDISRFVVQDDNFLGRSAGVHHTDYSSDEEEEVGPNNEPPLMRFQNHPIMNSNNNQLNNHSVMPSTSSLLSNSTHAVHNKKKRSKPTSASPMLSNHEISDMSACSTPQPQLTSTIWRKTSQISSSLGGAHHHLNNIKKTHSQAHVQAHEQQQQQQQQHNPPQNITSHDMGNMSICSSIGGAHHHLNNIKKTHSQAHVQAHEQQQQQQQHNPPQNITSHDMGNMSICSSIENIPPPMTPIWTKPSSVAHLQDGGASGVGTTASSKLTSTSPKQQGVWNSPWFFSNIAPGVGIQQRPDVIVGSGINNTLFSDGFLPPSSSVSNCRQAQQPNHGTREWWQKKALQLQQQLELTSSLCQSIIADQQNASSQSPASSSQNDNNMYQSSYAPVPLINSANSSFVPIRATTMNQQPVVGSIGVQPIFNNTADLQCQNLVAASQLHFQSMLLTSINHCYQMLWMQQKELSMLRNMVVTLQDSSMSSRDPIVLNGSCSNLITAQSQFQSQNSSRSNQQKTYPSTTTLMGPNSGNSENVMYQQSNYSYPASQNTNTINNFTQQQHNNAMSQQSNLPNSSNFNYSNSSSQTAAQNASSISPNMSATAQSNNIIPPLQFDNQQRPQCVQNIPQQQSSSQPQVNWNGAQALNNQVAPGNRANNYWDNFRSYSRQNLLSTASKSNEGSSYSPSPLIDRSHNTFRTNGIIAPLESLNQITLPKSNTNNTSIQDDSVKLTRQKKRQHTDVSINVNQCHDTTTTTTTIPSGNNSQLHSNNQSSAQQNYALDLAAQNSAAQTMHTHLLNIIQQNLSNPDNNNDALTPSNLEQRLFNEPMDTEPPSCSSNSGEKCATTKHESTQRRNIYDPNEWRENSQNDSRNDRSKAKLFDFLRDNVYKEVASLISANENRPHFLIQLFRDLQLISSDGLRHRTLQSIQGVVTDSLANLPVNGQGANRQNSSPSIKKENSQSSENNNEDCMKEIQIAATTAAQGDINKIRTDEKFELEVHAVIYNLVPFFHANADNICSDLMTETIRTLALQLIPTLPFLNENSEKTKCYFNYCQSQLNSYLERALDKFHGCRLRNVTEEILSVITDIVVGELYYLYASDTNIITSHDCTATTITNGEIISNESTITEHSSHSYPEQGSSPSETQDPDSSDHLHLQQHCNKNDTNNHSVVVQTEQECNYSNSVHNSQQQDGGHNTTDCQPSLLHNGDLAEADQSHENEEEEGAVGGCLLNPDDGIALIKSEDVSSEDTGGGNTEADLEWITFDAGLDLAAPTRLDGAVSTDNLIVSTDKPPGGDPTCD